jgi:hypothetical protein
MQMRIGEPPDLQESFMHTRTILDRIEIEPQTGNVAVRILKQIADDSGQVLTSQLHRTSIAPKTDPSMHMAAVNTHLATMGYPALSDADLARISAAAAIRP